MEKRNFQVKFSGKFYEIGEFLRNHPGGTNYLQGFDKKDVANRMLATEHSKSAFYLLREYKVDGRDVSPNEYNEDLEKLVNWNKPMLSQIASLGSKYNEWVSSPVDRKLRLFESPILEYLTITPWYFVPIIWIPVIFYYIYYGSRRYIDVTNERAFFIPTVLSVLFGVLVWTLIEYSLHRWVFHMEPSGKSKVAIIVHFTLHGLHHKVPFDSRRLVFPPFPAAIVVFLGFKIYSALFPEHLVQLMAAGSILGYVTYDMIHFYLHNGSPKEGSYMYYMKRYHNQHHFVHHNNGFGISSKIWDVAFGTLIQLRKLPMAIRW